MGEAGRWPWFSHQRRKAESDETAVAIELERRPRARISETHDSTCPGSIAETSGSSSSNAARAKAARYVAAFWIVSGERLAPSRARRYAAVAASSRTDGYSRP